MFIYQDQPILEETVRLPDNRPILRLRKATDLVKVRINRLKINNEAPKSLILLITLIWKISVYDMLNLVVYEKICYNRTYFVVTCNLIFILKIIKLFKTLKTLKSPPCSKNSSYNFLFSSLLNTSCASFNF